MSIMSRQLEKIVSFLLNIPLLGFYAYVQTGTHHEMTRLYSSKLYKASYGELKEKMLSVDWRYNPRHPDSLFPKELLMDNDYFHADIIKFDGVGYLLTSYGLFMAHRLQRKIRNQITQNLLYAHTSIN